MSASENDSKLEKFINYFSIKNTCKKNNTSKYMNVYESYLSDTIRIFKKVLL